MKPLTQRRLDLLDAICDFANGLRRLRRARRKVVHLLYRALVVLQLALFSAAAKHWKSYADPVLRATLDGLLDGALLATAALRAASLKILILKKNQNFNYSKNHVFRHGHLRVKLARRVREHAVAAVELCVRFCSLIDFN